MAEDGKTGDLLCKVEIELEVRTGGRCLYARRVTLERAEPGSFVLLVERAVTPAVERDAATVLAIIEATAAGFRSGQAGAARPALGYLLDLSARVPEGPDEAEQRLAETGSASAPELDRHLL